MMQAATLLTGLSAEEAVAEVVQVVVEAETFMLEV